MFQIKTVITIYMYLQNPSMKDLIMGYSPPFFFLFCRDGYLL